MQGSKPKNNRLPEGYNEITPTKKVLERFICNFAKGADESFSFCIRICWYKLFDLATLLNNSCFSVKRDNMRNFIDYFPVKITSILKQSTKFMPC